MSTDVLSHSSPALYYSMHTHTPLEHSHFHHNGSNISQKTLENQHDKVEKRKIINQAPWIPPPGRTSTGQCPEVSSKPLHRSKRVSPHRSLGDSRACFEPTSVDHTNDKAHLVRESPEPTNESELALTEAVTDRESPDHQEIRYETRTGYNPSWWNEIGGMLMDDLVHDVNNSVIHMARSARALSGILGHLTYEGQRLTQYDIAGLSSPRDDLLLHADLAVKACRSMCRWLLRAEEYKKVVALPQAEKGSQPLDLSRENQLANELQKVTSELELKQQQITAQQAEMTRFSTVNASLESLKAHLQGQLRQKELECCRMSSRVRSLQSRLDTERATLISRLEAVEADNNRLHSTKESLKRAVRLQKSRADRAEEALAQAFNRFGQERSDAQSPASHDENRAVEALHHQLAESREEREALQRQADGQLALLQAQLKQSNANNQVLSTYLAFLKRSYARVFQLDSLCTEDAMNEPVESPRDVIGGNCVSTTGEYNHSGVVKSMLLPDKLLLVQQDESDDDLDSKESCLSVNF